MSGLLSPRAGGGAAQRPGGELAGQVPLVVDRSALVGARLAVLAGDPAGLRRSSSSVAGLPAQEVLGLGARGSARRRPRSARCRRRVTVSPSSHSAAPAAATAQSPTRRSTFSYALPPPGRIGTRISMRSSAGPTTVSYGPVWNSRTGTVRVPSGAADHRGGVDRGERGGQVLGRIGLAQRAADGAAVAHDRVGDHPLGVARRSDSARRPAPSPAVRCAGSSRRCAARRRPAGCRPARSRSLMSMSASGLASRSFIIGIRLWPPATTRASSPTGRAARARDPRWSPSRTRNVLVPASRLHGEGVRSRTNVSAGAGTDQPRAS